MARPLRAAPRPASEDSPLDELDRRLIVLLQANGRATHRELAAQVDLSPPGLQKRLHKLEERGIVRGYTALIDRQALGLDLLCYVQVTLAHHEPEMIQGFREQLALIPEVLECHHLTGEFDYLMKVVVKNHQHLERFLFDDLTPIPGVDKVRTSIVLREIKESTALPVEGIG